MQRHHHAKKEKISETKEAKLFHGAMKEQKSQDMAVFLASDRSAYTSGVIVTIDGAR